MSNHDEIEDNEMSSGDEYTDDDDDDDGEMGGGDDGNEDLPVRTYLPKNGEDEGNLVCDESVYVCLHRAQTGAPCLSFDVIPDDLGDNRGELFPLTCHLVAGTQADRIHANHLLVLQMSNMHKNKPSKEESDDSDSENEIEEGTLPKLRSALISHPGCVNRIRVTSLGGRPIAATWSELRSVHLWDISGPMDALKNTQKSSVEDHKNSSPLFTFKGHTSEGFAMDWCTLKPGVFASGDCSKNIHLWTPQDGASWHVDQRPFSGHTASVEDIQWSPDEANVLASCSVDKSVRIWDMRAAHNKACMLTVEDAHASDVNVISWNHNEPFLLSGGDDGVIKVWDLRQFQSQTPVALFKHHRDAITSVEWHPTDASVYAASGADNQVTLWDLAVEKDGSAESEDEEMKDVPPQLLFIHQGQKDIKEVHWHPQMPGLVLSTALSGFNVFRTISV